jgi:hypothetical protein
MISSNSLPRKVSSTSISLGVTERVSGQSSTTHHSLFAGAVVASQCSALDGNPEVELTTERFDLLRVW